MTVIVNGRPQELQDGDTVAGLLARLGVADGYALVERNGEALERSVYGEIKLANGDKLVVARPVAGG
jgi:thiamine biosynthesis protein ThiS